MLSVADCDCYVLETKQWSHVHEAVPQRDLRVCSLVDVLKSKSYDALICSPLWALHAGLKAVKRIGLLDIPVIGQLNDCYTYVCIRRLTVARRVAALNFSKFISLFKSPLIYIIESIIVRQADAILVQTEKDRQLFKKLLINRTPIEVVPNGLCHQVDEEEIINARNRQGVLLIASAEGIYADIIRWFLSRVWPEVLKRHPGARLHLLGKGVQKLVTELQRLKARDSIRIETFQERLSAFYLKRDMAVCPVFKGYGLINKTIEALQHGCVTVGDPAAFNGINNFQSGYHGFIAQTDADFVHTIVGNLAKSNLEMRLAAHRLVKDKFNWQHSIERVMNLIKTLKNKSTHEKNSFAKA